ncbi:hypothetical protein Dsin_002576 [Dipteronia sinensis]|uniref:Uncharacterized protein n=1 Tax=Dipteronia sinensis TaxID=43782 RepID=A0AAE0ELD2_9ROSI|nr:hypothetical protein Dsin_002576 [Dipteronia sinensis]
MQQDSRARVLCCHVLAAFSRRRIVRVRGKNVGFSAKDINEWWETQSYPQWTEGYESKGIYQLYNQSLANELQDTEYAIWNTSNMSLFMHDLHRGTSSTTFQ